MSWWGRAEGSGLVLHLPACSPGKNICHPPAWPTSLPEGCATLGASLEAAPEAAAHGARGFVQMQHSLQTPSWER